MTKCEWACDLKEKVDDYAKQIAKTCGRGSANIEDQIRAAMQLEAGLTVMGDKRAALWKTEIDKQLKCFMDSILDSERSIRDAEAKKKERSEDLLVSFLLRPSAPQVSALAGCSSSAAVVVFDHATFLPIFYLTIQYCFLRFFSILNGLSFSSMHLSPLVLRFQVFSAQLSVICHLLSVICHLSSGLRPILSAVLVDIPKT